MVRDNRDKLGPIAQGQWFDYINRKERRLLEIACSECISLSRAFQAVQPRKKLPNFLEQNRAKETKVFLKFQLNGVAETHHGTSQSLQTRT